MGKISDTAKDLSEAFWQHPASELLNWFQVNQNEGLSDKEAEKRLLTYGSNVLKAKKSSHSFILFLSQFNSPLVYMLLFAAGLSLILYDKTDAIIIFVIILASTLLSFFQEKGAVKTMEKLLKIVQVSTALLRNGKEKEVSLSKVVPGDIVRLKAGDVIPGDCYLLQSKDLYVDEAMLTGESFYSEKNPGTTAVDAAIAKRSNALFMGTHVISGLATALVVATGKKTEFGKISQKLAHKTLETEFEHGIRRFGYFLIEVTAILLIVIFAFNVYLSRPVVESLLFSLALAVGLTPQLLPAIISINLAHGARGMARKRVIVKKLASIENFGSMNILCSDKTGTLTSGVVQLDGACDIEGIKSDKVLLYAYLNAIFQTCYSNMIDKAISRIAKIDISGWKKLDEVPYDFLRKRLSLLVENESGAFIITKGSFQQVVDVCTHAEGVSGELIKIDAVVSDLQRRFLEYSENGFRVLGLAYRDSRKVLTIGPGSEKEMIFLGFLLFLDPPKANVVKTIANLKKIGVSLKIITGDNMYVARHVAKLVGIAESEVMTGSQLALLSDQALPFQVNNKAIFAEIEPNQKERIILALRKAGHVVGYLGDGINDVTALHAADVGISVESGADVAKEAADIVLLKKDLSVLQEGIVAGRVTFANTLKYVFMATSANFGNMFSMAGASLFLSFLPLLPKQVLLTNLMTDFPEMTIATDNVDPVMVDRPWRWDIVFIRKFMLVFGLISSIFDYATFGTLLLLNASVEEFRTGWFLESVVSATMIVLVVRTFKPFYQSRPSKYLLYTVLLVILFVLVLPFTPLAAYLGFTVIPKKMYLFIGLIVGLYVLFVELAKKFFLKRWMKCRL